MSNFVYEKWVDIISNRWTTFSWAPDLVPAEVMEEVAREVHKYCPSKNRKMPYVIDIVRGPTDEETRKQLHLNSHRNTDESVKADRGNPQVLAPTLIVFSKRDVHDLETQYQTKEHRQKLGVANTDNIEIGMVALSFIHALTARGWNTALCQCVRSRSRTAELLGTHGKTDLVIGVGKETRIDSVTGEETNYPRYLDPRNGQHRTIPYPYGYRPYDHMAPKFEEVYRLKL